MEIQPISYKRVIYIINQLIIILDEIDNKIINEQKVYENKIITMMSEYSNKNKKFETDCDNAIKSLQNNSSSMIDEAVKIQNQIEEINSKLYSIDKYYAKTREKKLNELSDKKSDKFSNSEDYFEILKEIKEQFLNISQKYSNDILPSLVNGLNYLFSSKRKKDYEELIILENTVKCFVEEMKKDLNIATQETMDEMKSTHNEQKQEMLNSQNEFKEKVKQEYLNKIEAILIEFKNKIDELLPENLISMFAKIIEENTYKNINSSDKIVNNILYTGYLNFKITEFAQSTQLIEIVKEKCKEIMNDNILKIPMISSTEEPFDIYIERNEERKMALNQMIQGIMLEYLSAVPVMDLTFSVIDLMNHGNSVSGYFEAKKKMPELFGEKFLVSQEEAREKIYELNEKVDYISQEILGTEYGNIFEYKKENKEYNCKVEVITIFDFPKGMDEQTLEYLKNIILYGQRCGIYVIIAGKSSFNKEENISRETIELIKNIKSNCVNIQQTNNGFEYATIPYESFEMVNKIEFSNFISKYILISDGIKNKGIALPEEIQILLKSKDNETIEHNIRKIKNEVEEYENKFGIVPEEDAKYLDKIPIGTIQYPNDLFTECTGYEKIKKEFKNAIGKLEFPLFMNLTGNCNFLYSYNEESRNKMISFTDGILWSALSMFPISKININIIDSERKGGSVQQFLDFKRECPDLFGEEILTNKEKIVKYLEGLNNKIDDLIQNKLGNKYNNLLEYNRNNPNRVENCNFVVIYDFPSGFETKSIELLQNILKNGGKCGIYVLLGVNKDIEFSAYGRNENCIEKLGKYCTKIDITNKNYVIEPFGLDVSIKNVPEYNKINEFISKYKEISIKQKNKGFSFEDILDKELFKREIKKELSIPVGIGDGESIIPVVFGKGSSHHALVAGATGSGKSTLLHTLIMSAMLHYTPDKLNLYLMDFKGGTEFKIYDSYRIPHIKLLALDAMQEFGESILENLVSEIEKRSELFKSVNASKLPEYMELSGKSMPKILVIMDEFQILFNDSSNRKVAKHCAELTKRIVTEGRSYGIHLLMATQSTKIISELSLDSGTIEQMRIRIGLKCGEYDARYLFTDRNERSALEMMRGPIGTAVLNEEYTEQNNIGLRAAYCDDITQDKYLKLIEEKFKDYEYNMQSFEGSKTTELTEVIERQTTNILPLEIKVGTLIKVAPPLNIIVDKKRKHNTLICGSNEKMSENLSNTYILNCLLNEKTKVLCIDGDVILDQEIPEKSSYTEFLKFTNRFEVARERGDIIRFIEKAYDFYLESKKSMQNEQIMILIRNFQFLDILKKMLKGEKVDESEYIEKEEEEEVDKEEDLMSSTSFFGFGGSSSSDDGISDKLLKLIDDGSTYGINFIVTSLEFQSVKECMQYGQNILSKFPERYVFSLNDNEANYLIDDVSLKSLKDNTVYYTDSLKSKFQVKPYIFPKKAELIELIDEIKRSE